MAKTSTLTEGPITSTLIKFSVPFLLATLLQSLYGTVDTFAIGNFGTTQGLSAVSTGAQILGTVTYLAIGLSNGGSILVGQCIGAKNHEKSARVVGNMIIDFSVISVILMVLIRIYYPVFLNLLNVPETALSEAHRYMQICTLGIPMIIGYNIVCALLRAIGDSKSPLLFVFIASIVNIIGDIVLTKIIPMGAAGVAIATVTAQSISFIFALFYIMKTGLSFPFSRKQIRFDPGITAQIFKIGIPLGLQSILINISFMFITSIINAMGLLASAAMGVGDKIINFAFLPHSAFSQALSVIVAQNVGAKQPERAKKTVRSAIFIGLAIAVCFMTFCLMKPNVLPRFFTKDENVVQLVGLYMKAYSIDAVLTSITFCLSGMLNGSGKTTFNMIQNLTSTFLGRIPATYFLSKLPGTNLFLIGLAAPASSLISLAILVGYIGLGFWEKGLYKTLDT